jgi:hypothetical protein
MHIIHRIYSTEGSFALCFPNIYHVKEIKAQQGLAVIQHCIKKLTVYSNYGKVTLRVEIAQPEKIRRNDHVR